MKGIHIQYKDKDGQVDNVKLSNHQALHYDRHSIHDAAQVYCNANGFTLISSASCTIDEPATMNLSACRAKRTLSQQPYVANPATAMQSLLVDIMQYCEAAGTHDFETELEAACCSFEEIKEDKGRASLLPEIPKICPHCGGVDVITFVAEWDASSQDDIDNQCELDEHQCKSCEGKSFWT